MASFNQNIVRHEHDGDFDLVFTVSNSGDSVPSSAFCAIWILLDTETVTASSNIKLLATSRVGNNTADYDISVGADDCSAAGATNIGSLTKDIYISPFTNQIVIPFTYSTFSALDDGSYYHELILCKKENNDCHQCRSQVVASGLLTVNESLATNEGYRGA